MKYNYSDMFVSIINKYLCKPNLLRAERRAWVLMIKQQFVFLKLTFSDFSDFGFDYMYTFPGSNSKVANSLFLSHLPY